MVRIKRISAPNTFPVSRKGGGVFAPTTIPGPHSTEEGTPLGIALRDGIGAAENMREVKAALRAKRVTVNGRVRKDQRFNVGIFDIIGTGDENYRAVPSKRGFRFIQIPKNENGKTLVQIEDKTIVRGGRTQLNLSDGSNIITSKDYDTGDTLVLKVPDMKVDKHIPRKEGTMCMITRGRNVGRLATIKSINVTRGSRPNTLTLEMGDQTLMVPEDMAFPVGRDEPEVTIEED